MENKSTKDGPDLNQEYRLSVDRVAKNPVKETSIVKKWRDDEVRQLNLHRAIILKNKKIETARARKNE